jgi:hypothetical protein
MERELTNHLLRLNRRILPFVLVQCGLGILAETVSHLRPAQPLFAHLLPIPVPDMIPFVRYLLVRFGGIDVLVENIEDTPVWFHQSNFYTNPVDIPFKSRNFLGLMPGVSWIS